MDVVKVREAIDRIESDLSFLKQQIESNPTVNVRVNSRSTIKVGGETFRFEPNRPEPAPPDVRSLLDGPGWPAAVPDDLLCDLSEEDKVARAELLLDMTIDRNLEDLRFLDYGCGEGHLAAAALSRGVISSTGYDPFRGEWDHIEPNHRLRFTDRKESLVRSGYDAILLYDVLDHCVDPLEVLHHVNSLLAPGGVVYAACHPWCSRHGGHLYRQFNKAYAHMVLGPEELAPRGLVGEYIQPVLRPQRTYRQWFNTAGFKIDSEDWTEEPVEKSLRDDPIIWRALTRHYDGMQITPEEIEKTMQVEFVNYVLSKESIY